MRERSRISIVNSILNDRMARQSFGIWKELQLTNLAEIAERPLPQPEQKKKSTSRSRSIPKAKA